MTLYFGDEIFAVNLVLKQAKTLYLGVHNDFE